MKINKKVWMHLFCSFMLAGSLFASENSLQFEIVPFDYNDASMKEQWIAMMTDSSDKDMQKRFHYSQEDLDETVAGPVHDFQLFVCRTTDGLGTICGFMEYKLCDVVYCSYHPLSGFWFSNESQNDDECKLLEIIRSVGYIAALGVHKDYRGHGIAQAFLNHFELDCKKNGMRFMALFVDTDNEKAIKAYRKFGFEIDLAYNENVESYTMVKSIN